MELQFISSRDLASMEKCSGLESVATLSIYNSFVMIKVRYYTTSLVGQVVAMILLLWIRAKWACTQKYFSFRENGFWKTMAMVKRCGCVHRSDNLKQAFLAMRNSTSYSLHAE